MLSQQSEFGKNWIYWISGMFSEREKPASRSAAVKEAGSTPSCKSTKLITFLHQVGMEPTPENYQLAWEYHYGASSRFRSAIDNAIDEHGYLTESIARQLTADHLNSWNAIEIANLITGGNQVLRNGSKVIRQSHQDNQSYGKALETNLDNILQAPRKSSCHYTALVSLTKTMVVKSSEAQRQLEEASETLASMRDKLADATQQAETDQLTGLPNRWAFEKRLTDAMLKAREAMEPLTIAFIDIDHFKSINDKHGHETGDRVLKRIAKALDGLADNHCHVARHGGEEFVMLFLNKTADEAQRIVDDARENLCSHNFTNRANGERIGSVSFSAGVSSLAGDGDSRAMLRRADTALYEAKDKGRNQIVVQI